MSDQPDLDQYLSWNGFGITFPTRFELFGLRLKAKNGFRGRKGRRNSNIAISIPNTHAEDLAGYHLCQRLPHHQIPQFHIIYEREYCIVNH